MKTRDFADIIRAKLADDPALAAAMLQDVIAELPELIRAAELRGVRAGLKAAARLVESSKGPDGATCDDGDEGIATDGWNSACDYLSRWIRTTIDPAAVVVAAEGGPT